MKHIPTRYFTDNFTLQEKWDFMDKYENECWDAAKRYTDSNKISKNAIKIAEKVEKELGIKLFPLVNKIACKGFDISGGTYAFSMIDDKGEVHYFDERAKYYSQKRRTLYLSGDIIGVQ